MKNLSSGDNKQFKNLPPDSLANSGSMMKSAVPIIFILGITINTYSQKSLELKPIIIYGARYMYDSENVNGRMLQIPLLGINNAEVNRHYKNYTTFSRLGLVCNAPLLVYVAGYLFTSANFNNVDQTTIQILGGLAVVGGFTFLNLSNAQLRKAVDLYNGEISPHGSINFQLETLPGQQRMISAGFRFRF